MKVTISGPITHRCPFVDEIDVGTVTLVFDGPAPELHELRRLIASYHDQAVTHEKLTAELAECYPDATLTTTWTTAGMSVVVEA